MLNAFLNKFTKRILVGIFLILSATLFFSCAENPNRVYLDSWEYFIDDTVYTPIAEKDLCKLEKLLPGRKGYIYIKSTADVPADMDLSAYGLCIARISMASEILFDGKEIAKTGVFPPNKFSNGNRYTFVLLPANIVNLGEKNELKFKLYIEGSGGINGESFIGEYRDASNSVTGHNFIHSTLFLLIASFMLFSGIVYLVMFLKMQHDNSMIFFALMSLSTILFLFPSFIGNFPWILGFMNYDWFIKIFQGCFAMITAFLAVSFSSQYIGLREPVYFLCLRIGILVIGCIYCLLIPDTLHFYKLGWVTGLMITAQVIPFIPSAMIGLKMRAKIMGMMLGGSGEAPDNINLKNLPKGIPVGTTITVGTEEAVVAGPELPPQGQNTQESETSSAVGDGSESPQPENEASTDPNAGTPPEDDKKEEEKPKVISRYGVPPPPVQKMLRERAAQFEKKSKNKIYPKFLRKSFEEKVTYFIEMSEGMREPPEFMARMMGAPVGQPPVGAAPKPQTPPPSPQQASAPQNQVPSPAPVAEKMTASAPKVTSAPVSAPMVEKKSAEQILSNMGKANPPTFVKNMLQNGQIPIPGGVAVPLAGEMDDISMAQLKYAENTIGTIRQLMTGYMPTFIALILDIILRFVLQKNNLPYMTLFGWQATVVMFLFMLITNFAKIKKRGEYLSKNLREIVYKSTEELKQKAEELEKKNKQSQKDLEMAAQVQKTFYPTNPNFYGWDIAVDFKPLSSVSGDLYDFYELEGILRGFGLYDVSGHGISASLVTMLAKNSIFRAFRSTLSLSLSEAILRINNEVIRAKGNIENYLTGILFRVDRDNPSRIELVNAGSPYPVLKKYNDGTKFLKPEVDDVKAQHGMLGIDGLDVAFSTIPFTLSDNDTLVLYTDGLTEAENKDGEQYGKERLLKLISEIPDDTESNTVLEKIKASFMEFVGDQPLDDDISIIVLRRTEEVAVISSVEDDDSFFDSDDEDELEVLELESVDDVEELEEELVPDDEIDSEPEE